MLAPGDKSISHRALLFGALGTTPMQVAEPRAGRRCPLHRGVPPGARGRASPGATGPRRWWCGASARAGSPRLPVRARLREQRDDDAAAARAGRRGARVACTLDGDASLRRRPMRRVLAPLRAMGARVEGQGGPEDERAPLRVAPVPTLVGMSHRLPIASAQVKSALVLAGLAADGETRVREPEPSRDHTERMLAAWGAPVRVEAGRGGGHPAAPAPVSPRGARRPGRPLLGGVLGRRGPARSRGAASSCAAWT